MIQQKITYSRAKLNLEELEGSSFFVLQPLFYCVDLLSWARSLSDEGNFSTAPWKLSSLNVVWLWMEVGMHVEFPNLRCFLFHSRTCGFGWSPNVNVSRPLWTRKVVIYEYPVKKSVSLRCSAHKPFWSAIQVDKRRSPTANTGEQVIFNNYASIFNPVAKNRFLVLSVIRNERLTLNVFTKITLSTIRIFEEIKWWIISSRRTRNRYWGRIVSLGKAIHLIHNLWMIGILFYKSNKLYNGILLCILDIHKIYFLVKA